MININSISKTFKLYRKPSDRLKEILFKRDYHRKHTALDEVSFHLRYGESVGILGENGAGKSTLLKIIMGVLVPDHGSIVKNGKVTGLLELGTGFNPEYSGEDNIYFNGAFLNLSRSEIDAQKDNIIEFAELGEFIHEPLKMYSSGMAMRLAFSIAIHALPQCFLVDEALSVGDVYFQQKCFERLKEFKASGGSFIFVSHDMNAIKMFCDRAIFLHDGRIKYSGHPDDAVEYYSMYIAKKNQEKGQSEGSKKSWTGNENVRIYKTEIVNSQEEESKSFCSGSSVQIKIYIMAECDVSNFSAGILIRDRFGQDIFGVNTAMLGKCFSISKGEEKQVIFSIPRLNLGAGLYSLTAALHEGTHHLDVCYHWVERAGKFEVVLGAEEPFSGIARLSPQIYYTSNSS